MKKVSKGFYLGSIIGATGLSFILFIAGRITIQSGDNDVGFAFIILGFIPMIYAAVINCVLWYKAWASIQDGHARTTPGKAIGFLFIPIFNLYWLFQAFWGFAKDCNSYIDRKGLSISKLPEELFLTFSILTLLNVFLRRIPIFGIIFSLVTFVILVIVINKLCDVINDMQ